MRLWMLAADALSVCLELWQWHGKRAGQARATEGLLHTKFPVVDRQIRLVGSHNLDPRSEHRGAR